MKRIFLLLFLVCALHIQAQESAASSPKGEASGEESFFQGVNSGALTAALLKLAAKTPEEDEYERRAEREAFWLKEKIEEDFLQAEIARKDAERKAEREEKLRKQREIELQALKEKAKKIRLDFNGELDKVERMESIAE